jgi:protein-tyrosine phosphatase
MPDTRFSILFVCTGNICRSAMAERLLVSRLDTVGGRSVSVTSAGTRAVVGRPMSSQTRPRLRALGGDPDGFVATPLTEARIASADLILGMAAEHAERVLALDPGAFSRTFLLTEFVRAIETFGEVPEPSDPGRWRLLADLATEARRRGLVPARDDDDVADPYGRDDEAFDSMVRRLVPAVDAIVGRSAVLR